MRQLFFLMIGLLALLMLAACGGAAPTATPAQPAASSPEMTIYKSPT